MLTTDRARLVDTQEDAGRLRFVAAARQHVRRWLRADTQRVGRLSHAVNLAGPTGIDWLNAFLEAADPTRD
jgi:hypothetical protein